MGTDGREGRCICLCYGNRRHVGGCREIFEREERGEDPDLVGGSSWECAAQLCFEWREVV